MKERLGQDISKTLYSYLNEHVDENYDQSYVGVVEDNMDPNKWGRVRVRLHGLYDDIPTDSLPWASPNFPLAVGVKGSFIVPEIGTVVNVEFDDGDIYEPKYTTKCLDVPNLHFDANKDEDYPDSVIFYETTKGDYFKINRKRGEYTIKTGAGCFLKMHENGDITITNESSSNGELNVSIKGKIKIDNRRNDTEIVTGSHSTSAFGDISIKSNGGNVEEFLDSIEKYTNRDNIQVAGNDTQIKTRNKLTLGSTKTSIKTNELKIEPALGMGELTTDVDGIPTPITSFNMSFCENIVDTPFITVEPSPLGGPYNAIPFDTLTGAPHSGRKVTAIISPKLSTSTIDYVAEVTKLKLSIEAKYAKLLAKSIEAITIKYSSMDAQAQTLLNQINGTTFLESMKSTEIENITITLNTQKKEELDRKTKSINEYLKKPIFGTKLDIGTEENKRELYKAKVEAAETTAKADVTGMTIGKDIVGSGDGIVEDTNE
jgi:hypothetical protein